MKYASVAVIINDDGKVLVIHRGFNKNSIGLIGGKREPNESAKDNAIREVFEETGLIVEDLVEIHTRLVNKIYQNGDDFETNCFLVLKYTGEINSSDEGSLEWVSKEELFGERSAFPEYNRITFQILEEKFPNKKIV